MVEPLKDPINDRKIKCPLPPAKPLELSFILKNNKLDWKNIRKYLQQEARISKESLLYIINKYKEIIKNESNILHLKEPITIVGDIHGQYYDLNKLLELGGSPENT